MKVESVEVKYEKKIPGAQRFEMEHVGIALHASIGAQTEDELKKETWNLLDQARALVDGEVWLIKQRNKSE